MIPELLGDGYAEIYNIYASINGNGLGNGFWHGYSSSSNASRRYGNGSGYGYGYGLGDCGNGRSDGWPDSSLRLYVTKREYVLITLES